MKKIIIMAAAFAVLHLGSFQEPTTAEEMQDIKKAESEYLYNIWETMPDNIFESISLKLGDGASVEDITMEYLNNRTKYDTLGENTVIGY